MDASARAAPDRDDVLARLRAAEARLRAAGVAALYLFGSTARGEAGPGSDVDLFLEQAEPERFDIFDLLAVQESLSTLLEGTPVDLATRASLHPALRPSIEASSLRVF